MIPTSLPELPKPSRTPGKHKQKLCFRTRIVIEDIKKTLQTANCQLIDIVKAMVWLSKKEYFPGFNEVFSKYFPVDPPARSAVVNELLVDVKIEIEVIAYKPE